MRHEELAQILRAAAQVAADDILPLAGGSLPRETAGSGVEGGTFFPAGGKKVPPSTR